MPAFDYGVLVVGFGFSVTSLWLVGKGCRVGVFGVGGRFADFRGVARQAGVV
jgi:hypothetical protein